MIKSALLVLEDGTQFHGRAIGATGSAVGEVVFNTSMTVIKKSSLILPILVKSLLLLIPILAMSALMTPMKNLLRFMPKVW